MSAARIGALRRRLVLQTAVDTTDDTGAIARAFIDGEPVWAQVQPLGATRDLAAGKDAARVTHRVVLRWRADITASMRFRLDDRILAIRSLIDVNEERRWLMCVCEETSP
jgi:SPP1 family predicted phage head-tail adaptor